MISCELVIEILMDGSCFSKQMWCRSGECIAGVYVMRLPDQRWRVAGMMVDCLCSPGRSLGTRSGSRRCSTRVDRIGLGIAVGRS